MKKVNGIVVPDGAQLGANGCMYAVFDPPWWRIDRWARWWWRCGARGKVQFFFPDYVRGGGTFCEMRVVEVTTYPLTMPSPGATRIGSESAVAKEIPPFVEDAYGFPRRRGI